MQYLDRYLATVDRKLKLDELHIIGMTCMFVASKYEDVTPIFMETLLIRIGRSRFTRAAVLLQEKDILRTLNFYMAAMPTVLEFIDRSVSLTYFSDYPYSSG